LVYLKRENESENGFFECERFAKCKLFGMLVEIFENVDLNKTIHRIERLARIYTCNLNFIFIFFCKAICPVMPI